MFTNAFLNPAVGQTIELLAAGKASVRPRGDWPRRIIERWKTRAFVQAAVEQRGVKSPYALARVAVGGMSEHASPVSPPRIYENMAFKGQPGITKLLAWRQKKHAPASTRWVERLLELEPASLAVLSEPIWRLLDPTPLTRVEWHALAVEVSSTRKCTAFLPALPAEVRIIPEYLTDYTKPTYALIPQDQPSTRWGLQLVLLEFRRCELDGKLVDYHLNLLEVLGRLDRAGNPRELALFRPEIRAFLSYCFGSALFADGSEENMEHQRLRVSFATRCFHDVYGLGNPGIS